MTILKSKIANAITSAAENHVVAVVHDIYDEARDQYLEDTLSGITGSLDETIRTLDAPQVGGSGSYITTISETDGIISATAAPMPTKLSQFSNDTEYATSGYVDTKINSLINGAPETLDTLKEIADVVSGNSGFIESITTSISDINAALNTKANKATTLSGYGINDATITDKTIKLGSNTIDVAAVVTDAVNALDVNTISGSGKYIASVAETNGKISATLENMPTKLSQFSNDTKYATSGYVDTQIYDLATYSSGYVSTLIATEIRNRSNSDALLDVKINAIAANTRSTITVSPNYIYLGTNTKITINGGFASNSDITADSIVIKDDNNNILASGSGTTLEDNRSITLTNSGGKASKAYKVISNYNGAEFVATAYVNARYPIIYGFGANASSVTQTLSARYSAVATYISTGTSISQHMYICVPIGIDALTSFTMNGAPAVFDSSELTINGILYKVYTSANTYKDKTLTIDAK